MIDMMKQQALSSALRSPEPTMVAGLFGGKKKEEAPPPPPPPPPEDKTKRRKQIDSAIEEAGG